MISGYGQDGYGLWRVGVGKIRIAKRLGRVLEVD